MVNPRKVPKFIRQGSSAFVSLGKKWRKPIGRQSKLRIAEKSHGSLPSIGYMAPRNLRFLHPSGFREFIIHNLNELGKIDPKKDAVKIAGSVGKKKRNLIIKKADELKIKVLNKK